MSEQNHIQTLYDAIPHLRADTSELADSIEWVLRERERLIEAGNALARKHEGWQHGCGPCVCDAHQKWREITGPRNDQ